MKLFLDRSSSSRVVGNRSLGGIRSRLQPRHFRTLWTNGDIVNLGGGGGGGEWWRNVARFAQTNFAPPPLDLDAYFALTRFVPINYAHFFLTRFAPNFFIQIINHHFRNWRFEGRNMWILWWISLFLRLSVLRKSVPTKPSMIYACCLRVKQQLPAQ